MRTGRLNGHDAGAMVDGWLVDEGNTAEARRDF